MSYHVDPHKDRQLSFERFLTSIVLFLILCVVMLFVTEKIHAPVDQAAQQLSIPHLPAHTNGTVVFLPLVMHASPCRSGRIVFVTSQDGDFEIAVMPADGSYVTQLTHNAANDEFPMWSPDGSQIAFSSDRDGHFEIYVMQADGSNQTRLTFSNTSMFYHARSPEWSPDGSMIAFTGVNESYTTSDVYVVRANGSGLTRMTDNQKSWGTTWSPDGSQIAFVSNGNRSTSALYTMRVDDPTSVHLVAHDDEMIRDYDMPRWSPDGRQIVFTATAKMAPFSERIGRVESAGTSPRWVGDGAAADWSPDGSCFAFSRADGVTGRAIYVMNSEGIGIDKISNDNLQQADSPRWRRRPAQHGKYERGGH